MDSDNSTVGTPRRKLIDLSVVDFVSSYDDQSNFRSFSSDVCDEKRNRLRQQAETKQRSSSTHQPPSPTDSNKRRPLHAESSNDNRPRKRALRSPTSANPLRHYNLVMLANTFFLIGSILFICASWLEFSEHSNNVRSRTFLPNSSDSPKSGFHLKLSTSIDTMVTKQMILMLGATFCMLQVGIINLVRTPLEKFHFFQISAGLFGLLSGMFWETKTILSDIGYFFFVHCMTGQALMLLHYHFRTLIQPFRLELRKQQELHPREPERRAPTPSRRVSRLLSSSRRQTGHFALEPSQQPSGLLSTGRDEERASGELEGDEGEADSDGVVSFSVESSFSIREDATPESSPRGPDNPSLGSRDATSSHQNDEVEESDESQRLGVESRSHHHRHGVDTLATYLRYGTFFGIADGLFVMGSVVETALTYLTILVIPTSEEDGSGQSTWSAVGRVLNLIPGIMWLLYASGTSLNTVLLNRHVQRTRGQRSRPERQTP